MTSNRITNANYEYDVAGNLTRGQSPTGVFQRFQYDAAGRLVKVMNDSSVEIESYAYGASRQRLRTTQGTLTTYYAWGGSSVLCEYTENNGGAFTFSKSYIYAGSRLLSTQTWNGSSEVTEFHHPDRLGTKLVTNNAANTYYDQTTLPFGTALNAESTGFSNQVFTSYDRSAGTGIDYAVNRSYSSGQGRFTTVDPIGAEASTLGIPQSTNLYAYVRNNPVDLVDPSGLDPMDDFIQGIGAAQDALMNTPSCRNFFNRRSGKGIDYLTSYVSQQKMTYGTRYDYTVVSGKKTKNKTFRFKSGNTGGVTLGVTTTTLDFYEGGNKRTISAFPILINENGFFFSLEDKDGNDIDTYSEFSGLSDAEIRGAVILHELAHGMGIIPSDGKSNEQSKKNSELIKFMCFSAFAKRSRNPTVTTTSGEIDANITLRPGGGGGGGGYNRNYDPFRSIGWLLFEQWARGRTNYSVSVSYSRDLVGVGSEPIFLD
jgi:RHS repeat-associated protein